MPSCDSSVEHHTISSVSSGHSQSPILLPQLPATPQSYEVSSENRTDNVPVATRKGEGSMKGVAKHLASPTCARAVRGVRHPSAPSLRLEQYRSPTPQQKRRTRSHTLLLMEGNTRRGGSSKSRIRALIESTAAQSSNASGLSGCGLQAPPRGRSLSRCIGTNEVPRRKGRERERTRSSSFADITSLRSSSSMLRGSECGRGREAGGSGIASTEAHLASALSLLHRSMDSSR